MRFRVRDGLWARLVDVGAALAARGYAADGEVVFEVRDGFCPWREARYVLTASEGEAAAARATRPAELVPGGRDPGRVVLGGATPARAARLRRADDGSARVAVRLSLGPSARGNRHRRPPHGRRSRRAAGAGRRGWLATALRRLRERRRASERTRDHHALRPS